mmetsp:Transcript_56055/g.126489  ORF Transcript_56055/g.126489 Transcript_56055/m.126489 type:complete len:611 (-) Transcript_56055:99-1931(-)|eukprot:CAMPEP_0197880976 /NCGR_PEP_ID=MMETSP1439-20131203/8610_1 /TAXON_ID=66791 /ORGANISM="Gonyaulax spinifera, Strain CCMP409" /LENGTH=610 /DNA_ID=CAMNT_0043500553 /DNA_START=57 /DNA_END=1889 /DNA_ORIENTATION=+
MSASPKRTSGGSRRSRLDTADLEGSSHASPPVGARISESKEHWISRESLGYELRLVMREFQESIAQRVQQDVALEMQILQSMLRQVQDDLQTRPRGRPAFLRSGSYISSAAMSLKGDDENIQPPRGRRNSDGKSSTCVPELTIDGYTKLSDEGVRQFSPRTNQAETKDQEGVLAKTTDAGDSDVDETPAEQRFEASSVCGKLENFVSGSEFDQVTGVFIVINAIMIGVQTEYMSQHDLDTSPWFFRMSELAFAVVFTLELLLRLCVYRFEFFTMPGWKWNLFDSVVVGLQLVEMALHHLTSVFASVSINLNFASLRILRILRLIRIIRLVRVLRLVAELRRIVFSFVASLRPFCVTFLLLLMVIYITSVYLTQLILDHRTNHDVNPASREALDQYFRTLGRTALTLFESVAGGLSWDSAVAPLIVEVSPIMGVVFPLFIAFTVFACANVITGVFVESLLNNTKESKDRHTVNSLRDVFKSADADGSGSLSWEEFQEHMHDAKVEELFTDLDMHMSQAEGMFRLLDYKGDGALDMEDFVQGCLRLRGPAKGVDVGLLMEEIRRATAPLLQCSNVIESHLLREASEADGSQLPDMTAGRVSDGTDRTSDRTS